MIRSVRRLVGAAALCGLVLSGAPALAGTPRPTALDPGLSLDGATPSVVVSGRPGGSEAVRAAIRAAGGTPTRALSIVDGWAATVPAAGLVELASSSAVTSVTKDRAVQLTAAGYDERISASPYAWVSQAGSAWASGWDGEGVGVAVLDTGISHVGDLAGRVVAGPDLSGEGQQTVDSFGHGTVMAGIVAGSGAASAPKPRTGVAPKAHVVSVKVAGASGASDVSTMLAGLSWVAAFADTYAIKVLNVSWGVPSTQHPSIDPLDFAVERLWSQGVVVVAAAGNAGPGAGTILKPGDDPLVVTVGAFDDKGTLAKGDDGIPAWASQGPTAQGLAKPDLVASGRTLVATRAPGSTVERLNPAALVGSDYITGSGSSEATAVVSGVVALIRQAHPSWTPDQVKYALRSTASPLVGVTASRQGLGRVQAQDAIAAGVTWAPRQVSLATGLGTLEASRAGLAPMTLTCNGTTGPVVGDITSWCAPWTGAAWTGAAWTGAAWTGAAWTGAAWTGAAWTGAAWTGAAWTGAAWTGAAWTGAAWTGAAWTGAAWTGAAWTSYDESDGGDPPAPFQTAFFGAQPRPGLDVVGEVTAALGGILPTP